MRRILVDYAKGHLRNKRGGREQRVSLDEVFLFSKDTSTQFLALHESLIRLAQQDPRQSRIVELRFFGGLTVETGCKLHHLRRSLKVSCHDLETGGAAAAGFSRGSNAPVRIHSSKAAMAWGGSLSPPSGIGVTPFSWRSERTIRLLAGSPRTIAGPDFPPPSQPPR